MFAFSDKVLKIMCWFIYANLTSVVVFFVHKFVVGLETPVMS